MLFLDVGLDEFQEHDVFRDEAAGDEAILLRAHELQDRLVHSGRKDAHQNLVVAVKQRDGAVVAWVLP